MNRLEALRYLYNRRLSERRGIKGKVTVKFAIDHYGKVIFCKVAGTSLNDPLMEESIVVQIRSWKFTPLLDPGDVTEVVYPFVFSQ